MMDVGRHPRIELLTNSEVKAVKGRKGDFKVKILRRARYVDPNLCTSCGRCSEVCPVVKPNEFDLGLGSRKAIFTPFPQAVPSAYTRIEEDCLGTLPIACGKCAEECEIKCINLDDKDELVEVRVGSIIVATGVDYYDPREASEYGYARFENVVTSFELERILTASGPARGELKRFTDAKAPRRVAFIQCVGSRSVKRDIPYCSRICCMNSIKDSLIIREQFPEAEIFIFYIDMRAFGKGFEEFYERSVREGVKYIGTKPSRIVEDEATGDLVLMYENPETKKVEHLQVDMVVLSAALVPTEDTKQLAQVLGIELAKDGFFAPVHPCGNPLESTKPGIYLCGCATGPKDITDSIAEASGAAAKVPLMLLEGEVAEAAHPIEELPTDGRPRIGVFVCHCGLNIAGVLPVEDLSEYAKGLPDVVFAENVLFACAESTQRHIQDMVKEHTLNRVVVAACTPKTHEPIFRETLAKVGLNPYLFEMVNIRDHCSWVHQREPEEAAQKAKDLIRMGVARGRLLEPLYFKELDVDQKVLVIGGGVSGIEAATDLSRRGFKTYLVEKDSGLGGWVSELASLYPTGESGSELIASKLKALGQNVEVMVDTEISDIGGFVGNFDVKLKSKGKRARQLRVGAIVLAIGSDLFLPEGMYGYGKYPNVYTNMELERMLAKSGRLLIEGAKARSVAFVQCVGSRGDAGNPGCSRYCCQAAIKEAISLRKQGIDVTIFHRGVRVYSKGAEEMYRQARAMGVLLIPYEPENRPQVLGEKRAESIEIYNRDVDAKLVLRVDAVILSTGMIPRAKESARLAELLRIQRGQDRFFLERHPKFGPVETSMEGVFLCGCDQFPKDIADSISQASAVAAKVAALLSTGKITLEPIVSQVNVRFCRGCGKCVEICEFNAIELVDGIAKVNEALCKGCGTCASICPTGAIDVRHFTQRQIEAVLEAMLE